MATDLELLVAARTQLLTVLSTQAGRLNYNIDGQQVSADSLFDRLEKLNASIAAISGPIEIETQGTL
jgi:uncharacterized coiled-coil protein SlyX